MSAKEHQRTLKKEVCRSSGTLDDGWQLPPAAASKLSEFDVESAFSPIDSSASSYQNDSFNSGQANRLSRIGGQEAALAQCGMACRSTRSCLTTAGWRSRPKSPKNLEGMRF